MANFIPKKSTQLSLKKNGGDNCPCTPKESVLLIKNFPVRF